jgi:hypothetical protein
LEPGGLWNSDNYEIRAIISRDGVQVATLDLAYAGESSQFETTFKAEEKGTYDVTVYAFDPANGNTGLDRTTFVVK